MWRIHSHQPSDRHTRSAKCSLIRGPQSLTQCDFSILKPAFEVAPLPHSYLLRASSVELQRIRFEVAIGSVRCQSAVLRWTGTDPLLCRLLLTGAQPRTEAAVAHALRLCRHAAALHRRSVGTISRRRGLPEHRLIGGVGTVVSPRSRQQGASTCCTAAVDRLSGPHPPSVREILTTRSAGWRLHCGLVIVVLCRCRSASFSSRLALRDTRAHSHAPNAAGPPRATLSARQS